MDVVRLLTMVAMFRCSSGGDVYTFGELVENTGTWEHNGVVLLLHQIGFDGTLLQIRAGFRNTNTMWIQTWTQLEFSGIQMRFRLEKQWQIQPSTIGEITITAPQGQLDIKSGQHLGVFFPASGPSSLSFKEVYPNFPLYGSEYLTAATLSPGEQVLFGYIGYKNKQSIEFYIYTEETIDTTPLTTTITSPPLLTTTTTSSSSTTITTTSSSSTTTTTTSPISNTTVETTLSSATTGSTPVEVDTTSVNKVSAITTRVTVIAVSAVIGGLAVLATVGGCVLYRYRLHKREEDIPYIETSNPIYGVDIPAVGQDKQSIYDTIDT